MGIGLFEMCQKTFFLSAVSALVVTCAQGKVYENDKKKYCHDPGDVSYGWRSPGTDGQKQNWPEGTVIRFYCYDGYQIAGPSQLVCTQALTWLPNQLPSCIPADIVEWTCPLPQIKNGFVDVSKVGSSEVFHSTSADTLTVHCNIGYYVYMSGTLSTSITITCVWGGNWKATDQDVMPVCEPHSYCPTPESITHGSYTLYNSDGDLTSRGSEGSRAIYTCEEGYRPSEEPTYIFCHFGLWIGHVTECLKVESEDCFVPAQIENGQYELNYGKGKAGSVLVDAGTTVHYYCEDNFILEGQQERVCVYGKWDGYLPQCVNRGCPYPRSIAHGGFNFYGQKESVNADLVTEESKVVYYCNNGFKLRNSKYKEIYCRSGRWHGSNPVCEKITKCEQPMEIEHGNWMYLNVYHNFVIRSKIRYECNKGYQVVGGPDVITCQPSGFWSDYPPRCLRVGAYCPRPDDVPNGYYICETSDCEPFRAGTVIHYMCNDNYEPQGPVLYRKCLQGGAWEGEKQVCMPVPTTPADEQSYSPLHSNTLTVVVATSCSVLGLLLVVMVVVAVQHRKPPLPISQLCRNSQHNEVPPPPYTQVPRPPPDIDEHDRVALIAFADGVQVVLPSYEEAVCLPGRPGMQPSRLVDIGRNSRSYNDYRPLPNIPTNLRGRIGGGPTIRELPSSGSSSFTSDHHRNSIITTASTATRDNISDMLALGSMDTVNVSDGTSTSVTIETYDSGASNPSLALSQRATAGSLASSNGSLATDDMPLLDNSSRDGGSHTLRSQRSQSSQRSESTNSGEDPKAE